MSETIYYDGGCGLCHRFVRFVLARDSGRAFEFAPIGGETFRAAVGSQATLPDSLVLQTAAGALLTRSAAVLHALGRLGRPWRMLGLVIGALPAGLRDRAYDFIARVRHRFFARPSQACPIVPPELADRFRP